jgi:uncharacterized protein
VSLQQQLPEAGPRVRWVRPDAVGVGDIAVAHSLLLHPQGWAAWAPTRIDEIDATALDVVLAQDPELVLIGTGRRQRFLAPKLQVTLLQRGIGLECMDNAAAARTFNLLADEGRRVVAAMLLGGD